MVCKIACVQMQSILGNKRKNIERMIQYINEISSNDKNVGLIVFPELVTTGYECGELYESMAEEFPNGSTIQALSEVAKVRNVHLIFGFVERSIKDNKNVLYNSAVLIDNKGIALGCYRKSHLVEGEETKYFEKGTSYDVYDTDLGKIGIMICWDTAYPEVARILALKGAEIIAVPAAWEEPNGEDWDIVHMARSFDNVLYIVACNHVGTDRSLTFFGKSKIVGPLGRTIVEAGRLEEVISAEVDLPILTKLREDYYVLLKDRNPGTYGEIIKR